MRAREKSVKEAKKLLSVGESQWQLEVGCNRGWEMEVGSDPIHQAWRSFQVVTLHPFLFEFS